MLSIGCAPPISEDGEFPSIPEGIAERIRGAHDLRSTLLGY